MTNNTSEPVLETPTAPILSERDIVRAATNSPDLAADQFQLGDRVFPIVDLPYDDYISFLTHLQPVIEVLTYGAMDKAGIDLPGLSVTSDSFSATALIKLCSKSLPDMVCIMCRQSDSTVTVAEVKRLGKRPTLLAVAVIKQVKQNEIIKDFTSFFGQLMPLIQGEKGQ